MSKRKKKGAALVLVMILTAVLAILGTAILDFSLAEAKQVALRSKTIKAHYIARAGADATLKAWLNGNSSGKPNGNSSRMYLLPDGSFSGTPPTPQIGSFVVAVTNQTIPAAGDDPGYTKAIIESTATLGSVTQKSTVTIDRSSNVQYGHDLGWYSYNSGQIDYHHPHGHANGIVVVKAKDDKKLKFPNPNVDPVTFECDYMFLDSPVEDLMHNTLTLSAQIIVFNQTLDDFIAKNPNASVILSIPAGTGILHNGVMCGKVFFINSTGGYDAYYFEPGVDILVPAERAAHLTAIPAEDPYNIVPYYNKSIIWS